MGNDEKKLLSATIRLASENPELRPHLLPIVKQARDGEYIQEGDNVEVLSRKGWVPATVGYARPKRTGAVELLFTSSVGDLKFNAKSGRYDQNAKVVRYVGKKDPAAAKAEKEKLLEREMGRMEAKEDFAELGRKALEKFDPKPGDKVLIAYSNGPKIEEIVNGVNWKTGKVGVVKEKRRTRQEENELAAFFWRMNKDFGFGARPPKERDTRWIPAHQIVRVERLQKPEGVE